MNRHFFLLLCAGTTLLCGCLHTAASPETPSQTLMPFYTEQYPMMVKFLEFSANGQTFIAAGKYDFVYLYDASTSEKLAAFTKENTDYLKRGSIQGTGYIDDNIWYLAAGSDVIAVIRQIEPSYEIFRRVLDAGSEKTVGANKNHLAYLNTLLNWHDGSSYKIADAHPARFGYTLTTSSRVLTYNAFNGDIVLNDPVKEKTVSWNSGFPISRLALSADERYAVALSGKGKCVLWQLPGKERLGSCGQGGLSDRKQTRLAFQRDGGAFAVALDDGIKVYATQPYRLLMSAAMPKPVTALALSEGRLAASDEEGAIRVWNVADGSLLGEYAGNPQIRVIDSMLAFQPGGTRLAVSQEGRLMVFDLAATSSGQRAAAP